MTSAYTKIYGYERPDVSGYTRIQKFPLWGSYTEISGYTERIRRTRVDARCIRIKKSADTKISGYVWTGPYAYGLKTTISRIKDNNLCEKAKADTQTPNSRPGRDIHYNRNGRFHTRDGLLV